MELPNLNFLLHLEEKLWSKVHWISSLFGHMCSEYLQLWVLLLFKKAFCNTGLIWLFDWLIFFWFLSHRGFCWVHREFLSCYTCCNMGLCFFGFFLYFLFPPKDNPNLSPFVTSKGHLGPSLTWLFDKVYDIKKKNVKIWRIAPLLLSEISLKWAFRLLCFWNLTKFWAFRIQHYIEQVKLASDNSI